MSSRRFALNQRPTVAQPLDKPYRFIPLTQGQLAIVDVEDFDRLNQFPWFAMWNPHTKSFRAARTINRRHRYMHREVLQCESDNVDHWNHNTLDNRKKNLRECTTAQNARNQGKKGGTSRFKGVYWAKENRKWCAHIKVFCRKIHIGMFNSEEDAARAYDAKTKIFHGEFAYLNFPQDAPP